MQTSETKQKMLEMWFQRVYNHINLVESRVRNMDLKNPSLNKYDLMIDEIERQFENLKIVRKALNSDVLIQGFDHDLVKENKS